MRKILVTSVLLVLPFVWGCNGGGGPILLDDVCAEMQAALCSYLKKCELEWYFQFATQETCDQMVECDDLELDEMAKAVDAGRMAYDADLARTCLNHIREAECSMAEDLFDDMPDECEQVFTGLVAEDADCYREDECAQGLYCDKSVSECPGQCKPYKSIDEACNGGDCDPDVAGCDWQQNVCTALAGQGEICENVDCQEGLECDRESAPKICIRPGAAGASCTSNLGCQSGLECLSGICKGQAAQGQECDVGEDFEGAMFACETGLYCDADLVQQEHIGTCQPKKGSGQECIIFVECTSGQLCIGTQVNEQTQEVTPGTCGQPLGAGGQCNAAEEFPECNWDLYCDQDTCTARPGLGDTCIYGDGPGCMGDDLYCDAPNIGEQGACQKRKADEASCQSGRECLSYYCSGGTCQADERCIAP